jgi:hypothetical protein
MDATIAIVGATIIGPIAAVTITLWYQARSQRYQRRLNVFRALMQWRGNWLNPEWVSALNLVPVEFAGHSDILQSFGSLIDKFGDRGFAAQGEELSQAYNRAEVVFVELMQKIARALKIDLSGFDLRTRFYAPSGWLKEQQAVQALRADAASLLNGERSISVRVLSEGGA